MDSYLLPPGKTIYNALQEYVNEYTAWGVSKSCNATHTKCVNLKKFIKYIFDNNHHNNDSYTWNINKLCTPLMNFFESKLCFSLNEKYNIELIKQIYNFFFEQGNIKLYNSSNHTISTIFKEILCNSFANFVDINKIENSIDTINIIDVKDTVSLDKIFDSIKPINYNVFINHILLYVVTYDYYVTGITYSQQLLYLIDKFISTKNIPSRDNLILALDSNSIDIIKSFISAGAKLDSNIFNDLIDYKCSIENSRLKNIPKSNHNNNYGSSFYKYLISTDIVDLLVDNNYVPTKTKLLEFANKNNNEDKSKSKTFCNVNDIAQKIITKKGYITYDEFVEFTKKKILFKNYAKLDVDIHKEDFRKLCSELDID